MNSSSKDAHSDRVLVVNEDGSYWVVDRTPYRDVLADALEVAAGIDEQWLAIVAGNGLDAIERMVAAHQAGHAPAMRLWLAASGIRGTGPAELVKQLGWVARRARRLVGDEIVFVLRDADLEHALINRDRGPALVKRSAAGELIALVAQPKLDPRRAPDWSDDEVRRRENERWQAGAGLDAVARHRGEVHAWELFGTRMLQSIADDRYRWALLPTQVVRSGDDSPERLARLGIQFGRPLRHDPLFRPARLPVGWTLRHHDGQSRWLVLHDERDVPRVEVFYKAGPADRKAYLRLV